MPCPVCGTPTAKVHGYHGRTVTDVPVDGRPVVDHVRVQRLVCPVLGCRRQTFREQIAGLLERHQRHTVRLAGQISQVARELCGRAAARLAVLLAVPVSRSTALRLPVPTSPVPRVIGVDDFALRRRHRCATIMADAETGRRVVVLPDGEMATLESWFREHPGMEGVCRDGATRGAVVGRVDRRGGPNDPAWQLPPWSSGVVWTPLYAPLAARRDRPSPSRKAATRGSHRVVRSEHGTRRESDLAVLPLPEPRARRHVPAGRRQRRAGTSSAASPPRGPARSYPTRRGACSRWPNCSFQKEVRSFWRHVLPTRIKHRLVPSIDNKTL